MTLDEVIGGNVHRLRDRAGFGVTELARRLHVSRHRIYDMERSRPDRDHHPFTFTELVALCAALGCSIFELVLPAEGETVDAPPPATWGGQRVPDVEFDLGDLPDEDAALLGDLDPESVRVESVDPESVVMAAEPLDRETLSWGVFHFPASTWNAVIEAEGTMRERFEGWQDTAQEIRQQAEREMRRKMSDAFKTAMEGESE